MSSLSSLLFRFCLIGLCAAAGGVIICQDALRAQEDVAETPTAKVPTDLKPIVEAPITASDREHWAYAPVVRPQLPRVTGGWVRNPVDLFILTKLEKKSLAPADEASRATLLRRLKFDLAGLPPTPEELAAYEADQSPDAYERVVDRLLAAPAFGERWGQHWLDLARFADTDGFEHDKVRPDAWKYRDWVIAALNADVPYDEFVRLQVAGDQESGGRSQGSAVPTMFCLAGPDMPDVNDQAERRHNLLNELTATVGSAFLGLQLGCAQCHDHKYDPLSQADFYRLRAVFEPAVATLKRDVPYTVLKDQPKPAPARLWLRGDHRRPGAEVPPGFPRIATLTRSASEGTRTDLANWLMHADNPLTSRVMANRLWQHHFGRGICDSPSDFGVIGSGPTHPELLDWLAVELRERGWGLKRMHRLMVGSATYRQGGAIGDLDRNPKSSIPNPKLAAELYAHFPRRRLDGEAIRDSLLAVAGLVSSERGGPGVLPPLPEELVSTLLKGQWTTSKREADHYRRSVYVFARRNLRYPLFDAFDRPDANASCAVRNRSTTAPQSLVLFNSEFSLLAARHLAGRIAAEPAELPRQVELLYLHAYSRRPTPAEAATLAAFLTQQRERLAAEGRSTKELALPAGSAPTDPYAGAALVDACLALLNASEFLYVD